MKIYVNLSFASTVKPFIDLLISLGFTSRVHTDFWNERIMSMEGFIIKIDFDKMIYDDYCYLNSPNQKYIHGIEVITIEKFYERYRTRLTSMKFGL